MESVYQRVTNSLIEELKQGVVPWVRPWKSSASPFPRNVSSKRPYRGVNILLLWAAASSRGYANPGWLTFRQARELGGTVKQGEHATAIVYAAKTKKVAANESGEEIEKDISFLKFYFVFNVEQTTLPALYFGVPPEKPLGQRHVHAELFLGRIGATVRHEGDKAYYASEQDIIVLPRRDDFESLGHYYATSLHEHVHYSGHPKRLHRDLKGRFGSRSYAGEELVAELGAAFLCSKLEIQGELRHAAYIASWLELLEDDSRAIFTAAGAASQAADYLCSFSEKSLPAEAVPA